MIKQGLRIAIVGPESTGKTVLARNLAEYYRGDWVPEFARTFIEQLDREYSFEDVKKIAKKIVEEYNKQIDNPNPVFFDTEMIITKVWFDVVFKKQPKEMQAWLKQLDFDAFLLLYPDLPWEPDPVRENGGEMRKVLFDRYRKEIDKLHKPLAVVSGEGATRIYNAVKELHRIADMPDLTAKVKEDFGL